MKYSFELSAFLLAVASCVSPEPEILHHTMKIDYPFTPQDSIVDDYHGRLVSDPYRWLEDDHAENTMAWVKEQNKVTEDYLDDDRVVPAHSKRMPTCSVLCSIIWLKMLYIRN